MGGIDRCHFFNPVATVNVFTESKTCRNSTVHFARLKFVVSFQENEQTRPQLVILTNSNTCFPPEVSRDMFYQQSQSACKDPGYRE